MPTGVAGDIGAALGSIGCGLDPSISRCKVIAHEFRTAPLQADPQVKPEDDDTMWTATIA
jgi:hypothetical protein